MKSGTCPKCGSEEIFSGADVWRKGGAFGGNRIPIGLMTDASLDNLICADCGYVESYVSEPGTLDVVRKKWQRVRG